MYYNPDISYTSSNYDISSFLNYDNQFNENAGIYDLDMSIKYLRKKLDEAIECIINDEEVKIKF